MATTLIEPPPTQLPVSELTTAPINLANPIKKKGHLLKAPKATTARKPKTIPKERKPKVERIKKPHHKADHPAWAKMMCDAIKVLNEKHGSSIPAIKKYILANYKVDAEHISIHMRRGMKAALGSGLLTQVKGHGLSGSFKLGKGKPAIPKKETKRKIKKNIREKKLTKKPKTKKTGNKKSEKPKKNKAKAPTKKITKKSVTPGKTRVTKKSKAPKAAKVPKPKTHRKMPGKK